MNAGSCKTEHLLRIFETLKKRGVNALQIDEMGRSALHYAVKSKSKELVDLLITQGADPKLLDKEGHSPLTFYLKGK